MCKNILEYNTINSGRVYNFVNLIIGGPVHDEKHSYFRKALYTFDIGQNDLGQGFFGNLSIQQVNASVPDIVNSFSTNFKVNSA